MTDITTKFPIYKKDEYPPDANIKVNGAPGTGKTTQTTQGRLIHEIKRRELNYLEYTVCTYRRSLSQELISTLHEQEVLSKDIKPKDTYIGTIHAICRRLINNNPNIDIKIAEVVTDAHKQKFCERYGQTYFTNSYQKSAGQILFDIFSYMLNNNITPKYLPQEKIDTLNEVWGASESDVETTAVDIQQLWADWESFKTNPPEEVSDEQLWDFDELLLLVREHELIPPNEFLIIDEMHDAYPLLNDVVQLWIEETRKDDSKTVIVAGDPHQVINEYQGSTPKYFNNTDLPEIVLDTTYRCPKQVWEYAESIISHEFTPKNVTPNKNNGSVTEYNGATFESPTDKDGWVLQEDSMWTPHNLLHEYAETESKMMILTRTRTQLHAIASHLRNNGVIYGGTIPSSWTEQKHHLHIYNTLKTLKQISSQPSTTNYKHGVTYDFENEYILTKDRFKSFISYLPNKYLKNISTENIEKHISSLPDPFNINETYFVLKESVFTDDIYDILSSMHLSDTEHTKLYTALQNDNNTQILDDPNITLHTIHESKGMQSETVLLYDGITTNIYESLSTEAGLQNECRVWYVGASRASKHLAIIRNSFTGFYDSPYLPQPD